MTPNIITTRVRQPGNFEFVAQYEGSDIFGGFGHTEEEAIADLMAKYPAEEE